MKLGRNNFLRTTFVQLSVFFFAFPANGGVSKTITPAMKKVTIDTKLWQPDQNPEFLEQAIYFGGQRNNVAADGLFQQVMGWGMGLTAVQFPTNNLRAVDYIPGSPDGYENQWKDGAYGFAYSCSKYGEPIAKSLNEGCKNCGKTYFLGLAWGTLNGMNFDRDAVMISGCSALEVVDSDDCFANFPNRCSIRAVGQPVELRTKEPTRIVINSKSRAEIIAAIKRYAAGKHQNIAVPSS
ncbi:uncharacterized protein FA14DRAFT_177569 [Meira miltonrushii]|uniref:DUF4189 domain-containing protein n=1 Tax=Meira miltonrushii TaxID=1280837 RepID=A0A316VL66_9BASI|nr:uncharacterized protein FA14DRAFT_177569 [Meira miltonrushii]PWN38296.1 hypothetical protein FA14DRAFT_177569 [Meira miltonrushii]